VRCVLIYNPASGRNRHLRAAKLCQISEALSDLGHGVELTATTAPGSATIQAREALLNGAEIIFACGGDGTIHEVLQGLVSEKCEPTGTLGIIPLGSANALAHHLRLSLDPMQAALQEIHGAAQTIPIGKVTYGDQIRYFAVMAGAGPDGALVYNLLTAQKSNLGRMAYYIHAARLFATRRFHPFEIEFTRATSNATSIGQAVSAMAIRVDDLGGLFSKLTGGQATINDAHLRLLILRAPAALSLLLWFALGWLNLNRINPFLSFADVTTFSCRPTSPLAVHFQADGEWLGRIPMQVSIVPNALRVLLPARETYLPHDRKVSCG
jgi:YegS/Rv2252/BmrU family lipid kinase